MTVERGQQAARVERGRPLRHGPPPHGRPVRGGGRRGAQVRAAAPPRALVPARVARDEHERKLEAAGVDDGEQVVDAGRDGALLPARDHRALAAGALGELCLGEPGAQPRLADQMAPPKPGTRSNAYTRHARSLQSTCEFIFATRAVRRRVRSADETSPVGEFLEETVLPALAARLDTAFPEFGWRPDARGWVATNEEMTHRALGRARRTRRRARPGAARLPRPRRRRDALDRVPQRRRSSRAARRSCHGRAELAARAGVDTAPIERAQPRDRRTDLLHDFFTLCRMRAAREGGRSRARLSRATRLPRRSDRPLGLGVVPPELITKNAARGGRLLASSRSAHSGVLADGRWPGRALRSLARRARQRSARSGRAPPDADSATRYLYLRGAGRSGLPPYGLSDVLRLPPPERRELVLVEGLIDVHHLRAHGLANIAAVGGARIQPESLAGFTEHGIESVVLAFDNDAARPRRPAYAPSSGSAAPRRAQRSGSSTPNARRREGSRRLCARTWHRRVPCPRRRGGVRDQPGAPSNSRAARHSRQPVDTSAEPPSHGRRVARHAPGAPALEQEDAIWRRRRSLRLRPRPSNAPSAHASGSEATRTAQPGTVSSRQRTTDSITPSTCERSGHPHLCSASWRMAPRPARASREARARIHHAAVAVGQRDRSDHRQFRRSRSGARPHGRRACLYATISSTGSEGSDVEQSP